MIEKEQVLSFRTKQEFVQVAFDTVAKIVSDNGQNCLESLTCAISAEKCLFHLASVAHDWSYDATLIDAYANLYKSSNQELIDAFGDGL